MKIKYSELKDGDLFQIRKKIFLHHTKDVNQILYTGLASKMVGDDYEDPWYEFEEHRIVWVIGNYNASRKE